MVLVAGLHVHVVPPACGRREMCGQRQRPNMQGFPIFDDLYMGDLLYRRNAPYCGSRPLNAPPQRCRELAAATVAPSIGATRRSRRVIIVHVELRMSLTFLIRNPSGVMLATISAPTRKSPSMSHACRVMRIRSGPAHRRSRCCRNPKRLLRTFHSAQCVHGEGFF